MLNVLGALLFGAIALTQATLASVTGDVPITLVGVLLAAGFAARAAGLAYARARREWTMPWTARLLSWLAFGFATTTVAIIGAARLMFVFGAFVALDAATSFVKREVKERAPTKRDRTLWQRLRFPLIVATYLALVVAFHLLVGQYLPYGVLVTWSLLALGFALLLRFTLVGEKADEAWLRAPADHRLHERREESVADPQRVKAEAVLQALQARGDASGFIEFVRTAARDAELGESDALALEQRILASLARAGTRRDEDVQAALLEVERFLSPRKEIRPA